MRFSLLVSALAAIGSVVAHNQPHPSPKPCQPTPQCPPEDLKGNPLSKSYTDKIAFIEYRVCEYKHKKTGGHHRREAEAEPSPVADPEDNTNELWARGDEDGLLRARDIKALEEWAKRGGGDQWETEECYYLNYNGKLALGDRKYCTNQVQLGGCPSSPHRRSAEQMAQAQIVRDYYNKRARRAMQV